MRSPMGRLRDSLTKDNIWLYILSILKDDEMHAYGIHKEMKKRFGWAPTLVAMYVVLYRLESSGYVVSKHEGRRKIYILTDKGINELSSASEYISDLLTQIN